MRKGILFFFLLTVSLSFTSTGLLAQLQLVEDNFEYVVGTPITDFGWLANGNPGFNTILVCEPGLDFPCYVGSGLGNACALNSNGPDAYKLLSRKIDAGSAYVSFMVTITSAQDGDYFFHLSDSTSSFNSDIGRVYARDSAGMVAFGLNKEGNSNEIYTPAQYFVNTTYLVIIKYTFVPGSDNDLVSLFVFTDCPPFQEPLPTLGPMGLGEDDLPEVGKVTLRQGAESHAPTLIIDGIYLDTSWGNGSGTLTMKVLLEAIQSFIPIPGQTRNDTVTVTLRNTTAPYEIVDVAKAYTDTSGIGTCTFTNIVNGVSYYLVVNHRNSIELWSAAGQSFIAGALSYDFTTAQSQAFGINPMAQYGTQFYMYSGDINQDGTVDGSDFAIVDNDAYNFVTGPYVISDLNFDQVVDGSDAVYTDNNSFNFITRQAPPGAVFTIPENFQ